MNFSELIKCIRNGDEHRTSVIIDNLKEVLEKYLIFELGANDEDARDTVQDAFIIGIEKIQAGEIEDKDKLLAYFMTTSRNLYLGRQRKITEHNYDRLPSHTAVKPRQISHLISEERKNLLEKCLEMITDSYEELMRYWLNHADDDAAAVAKHFKISVNNVWTRKHRALKALQECLKKN